MAADCGTLTKINIENITQLSRWLERLVRLLRGISEFMFVIGRRMSYLAGFTSGFFPNSL